MLLATYISLFQTAFAQTRTTEGLMFRCPDGYFSWNGDAPTNEWSGAPTESDWYFGEDWANYLADGTTPDGKSGVFPAGFRQFTLTRYSEPPICIKVGDDSNTNDPYTSADKKVEILLESPMENVNLCIHDAKYTGTGNNDVGSVSNCGTGKLYACFTAATYSEDNSGNAVFENFGFYVDCETGCEDMDIDVWIRIRVSEKSWDEGKETTADDLEHWCEAERGTELDDEGEAQLYYTYPSDLLPDEPSQYPFHIQQIFGKNAGHATRPNIWAISAIAVVGLACLFAA